MRSADWDFARWTVASRADRVAEMVERVWDWETARRSLEWDDILLLFEKEVKRGERKCAGGNEGRPDGIYPIAGRIAGPDRGVISWGLVKSGGLSSSRGFTDLCFNVNNSLALSIWNRFKGYHLFKLIWKENPLT